MVKKTVSDLGDLKGKRVLVRVDFNCPVDETSGEINNDRRIRAALPTLESLLEKGTAVVVMSHLGRPEGGETKDSPFTLCKVAQRLGELLGKPVSKVDEVAGENAQQAVKALKPGEVLVLENLRFDPAEQRKGGDPDALASTLASFADVYVNDAFGTCHREDTSMVGVPAAMSGKHCVVGHLVAKELDILDKLLASPPRPMLGILGGGKVSDKIEFIKSLLQRVDRVIVGGAMTYTFMKAIGRGIGNSRCESKKLDLAREILALAGNKLLLPEDHLIVEAIDAPQTAKVVEGDIPDGWIGVDIGAKTIARYCGEVNESATIVWNGPLGKFEDEPYSAGTRAVAEAMSQSNGVTIVGGGETAEAVEEFGYASDMTHVSTGGGAFLEYFQGESFAALAKIDDK